MNNLRLISTLQRFVHHSMKNHLDVTQCKSYQKELAILLVIQEVSQPLSTFFSILKFTGFHGVSWSQWLPWLLASPWPLSRCAWNILQGGYGWLSERKLERWKIRQKMQRIECSSIVVPPDQNHLVYKVTATGNMHFFVFREYYGFKLHNYMVGRKITSGKWIEFDNTLYTLIFPCHFNNPNH